MSVLFDALNRAAQEYRKQKAPVIVPLARHSCVRGSQVRWWLFVSAMIVLVVGASVAGWVFAPSETLFNPKDSAALNKIEAQTQSVGAEGITLSADSLDPEAKEQTDLEQVEAQLADMPSSAEDVPEAISPSGLTIVTLPSEKQTLLTKAAASLEKRQWKRALRFYDAVLELEPDHHTALVGRTAVFGGRRAKGDLALLDKMLDEYPELFEVHAARAHILAHEGREEEAIRAWEKALEGDPERRDYRLSLAILYDRLGRADEALELYGKLAPPLPLEAQRRLDYLSAHQQMQQAALSDEQEE